MSELHATALATELERLVANLVRELGNAGRRPGADLTLGERFALATVADRGALRLGAVASALGTSQATASRTVDALVEKGLLTREADPDDRRAIRITATARGNRILSRRRALLATLLAGALDALDPPHQRQLLEHLRAITDHLADAATPHRRPRTGARPPVRTRSIGARVSPLETEERRSR
jgi:DNA-binding MarR family transcriptional regulator